MSSLSRSLGRLGAGVVIGLGVTATVWSLPVGDEPPAVESSIAAPSAAPAAPEVATPEVGDGVAERAVVAEPVVVEPAPVEAATVEAAPSTTVPPEPDHLAPIADETPEPDVVVTTTTTLAPPTTTKAPAPAVTVAFSATQQYGSCGDAVPYDIFSGTANPGSRVTVSSAYGSGSAVADSGGHWSVKVEFPSAPRGETFAVNLSGPGGSTTLSFTATGDHHA